MVVIHHRAREAQDIAVNVVHRIVKAKEGGRFVRILVRIVGSWIVEGGIVGGQTRSVRRVGCEKGLVISWT